MPSLGTGSFAAVGDPGAGRTTLVKHGPGSCALGAGAIRERLGLDEDLVPIFRVSRVTRVNAVLGERGSQTAQRLHGRKL